VESLLSGRWRRGLLESAKRVFLRSSRLRVEDRCIGRYVRWEFLLWFPRAGIERLVTAQNALGTTLILIRVLVKRN
jgi:hypothetical protein